MVFIERGDCLFIEKLAYARQAGALGVVVWHNTEERFNPSAEPEDIKQYGAAIRGGIMLVVPPFAASIIQNRLRLEEEDPTTTAVMVQIEREWPVELLGDEPIAEPQTMPTQTKPTSGRVLYINGHAMMNTELLF
jgi:mannosidase alpha-like ER degradation enhancer 1